MANAGRLEPGAQYVYERVGTVTYARKVGDPPDQRFEIGRDYDLHDDLMEHKMWGDIMRTAKTNPALQEALDRAKLIYILSRQDKTTEHHPV